jgi:solute carrier family 25 carnitine/acylcarnitine transporter 20/29
MSDNKQQPVTAVQDLIAGGIAGSASVIVGHPFDTYKVRLQTSNASSPSGSLAFGGISSLFRGMVPPLSTAAVVNALIFSSYGESSRIWDDFFSPSNDEPKSNLDKIGNNHNGNPSESNSISNESKWKKAFVCGSFAGAVQALVICPSEHVKCRLQIQHGVGCKDHIFKGPFHAIDKIFNSHGIKGLYRGFICTAWREVPAFGLYFATYDFVKESVTNIVSSQKKMDHKIVHLNDASSNSSKIDSHLSDIEQQSSQQWLASALAGGFSGALTWAAIYPFDVIKTRIQTTPLNTPIEKRRITYMFNLILKEHGIQYFFRGLGVTLVRAFPVNAIIFPVYEFILFELSQRGIGSFKTNDYIESTV